MEPHSCAPGRSVDAGIGSRSAAVRRLQIVTVAWMVIECGVSLFGAWQAKSAVLLAFGSDSFVELLSAIVVLAAFSPRLQVPKTAADRTAGILLFLLAGIVGLLAVASLAGNHLPQNSPAGLAITVAALMGMPVLAWRK